MGMLIRRHRDRNGDQDNLVTEDPKPGSKAALQAEAEALGLSAEGTKAELAERIDAHKAGESDPYADLTDEQVLEAYATNIPDGEAEDRDAMVAELQALDAEGGDQPE